MKYDKDYFIAKFEAIPEHRWTMGTFVKGSKSCAYGHCGCRSIPNLHTEESLALWAIGGRKVLDINDGLCPFIKQPTPKQRILAWLRSL